MENCKVELLPVAFEDLDEIFDYILLENPTAAKNMLDNIMTAFRRLEQFPYSGVKLIDESLKYYNFRMLIIEPYVAFYRLIDNMVYVYRILHGTRDYIRILKNIKSS